MQGDLVDGTGALLDEMPPGCHVVVLSSWALAYVERDRRTRLLDVLHAAAGRIAAGGGRMTLLTLEADHLLPWVAAPEVPPDAPAEIRHASLLAVTSFEDGRVTARPLARCQAHVAWMDRLDD